MTLPDDLEQIRPGPYLAAILSGVDRSLLSGHDTVRIMQARNRQVAHDQAELLADMAEVSHRTDEEMGRVDDAFAFASDEIRAALTKTRRAAEADLGFATDLIERLPHVWEALHHGDIDVPKAKTMVYGTSHLPFASAITVTDRVLESAPRLTTGELRALVQKVCLEADPAHAKAVYAERLRERRVESRSNPEGTANLHSLDLAPHNVAAIRGHIESRARQFKQAGDQRSMDQLRADIFVDLLLGKTGTDSQRDPRAVVTMTSSLESLAALAEDASDIQGLGPVIADVARQVLEDIPDAELCYRIDSPHGVIIGTPARGATRALRRHVETRDPTCVAPGCRMPARQCDIDHMQRWADGGKTTDDNSAPLCRHDHRIKDCGGWRLERNPDGTYTWMSRLGNMCTTGAPP